MSLDGDAIVGDGGAGIGGILLWGMPKEFAVGPEEGSIILISALVEYGGGLLPLQDQLLGIDHPLGVDVFPNGCAQGILEKSA